jgi:predicted small lipoprotein YifL
MKNIRKYISLLLALMLVLALAACGDAPAAEESAPAENAPAQVGGWTIPEDAAVSEEARAAFDKALEGLTGVSYQPVALVGTQLVSGTNYCILCEARVVYPDAVPYYALVYVYADLQGGAKILNIVILDIGDIAETGELKAAEEAPAALMGGWSVDRESSVETEGAQLHLASQVVNGTNHCVLCKGGKLAFVYEDLEGKTELKQTVALDPGALNG